jgi:hypothetical protein
MQHQNEWDADSSDPSQPPPGIEPEALIAATARVAVARILTVARRLGQHWRTQGRNTKSIRLERADVPPRHARQRKSTITVGGGNRMLIELVRK